MSDYRTIKTQISALIENETNTVANLANISAVLFNEMQDINWAGFYIFDGDELVLGPFQGRPACIRIPIGKGVCGLAFAENKTQVVEDVHAFDGHIACDAASNSEIVLPLSVNGQQYGVLDIDSPLIARFNNEDANALSEIAAQIEKMLERCA